MSVKSDELVQEGMPAYLVSDYARDWASQTRAMHVTRHPRPGDARGWAFQTRASAGAMCPGGHSRSGYNRAREVPMLRKSIELAHRPGFPVAVIPVARRWRRAVYANGRVGRSSRSASGAPAAPRSCASLTAL